MKTKLTLLLAALVSFQVQATDDLTAVLQQALFNEEADHDLAAAIKAYQLVVAGADAQRKLTATAVFRLGECYRKLGQTNEAVAQYQRIVAQFADQTNLLTLSLQNLIGLGANTERPRGKGMMGLSFNELLQLNAAQTQANARSEGPGAAPDAGSAGEHRRLLERALVEQQTEASRLASLLKHLQSFPRTDLRRILPTAAPDSLLNALLEQFSQSEQKLSELLSTRTAEHPDSKSVRDKLTVLNNQIDERIDSIIRGTSFRASVVSQQVEALKKELEQASKETQGTPEASNSQGAPALTDAEEKELKQIKAIIRDSPDLINAKASGGVSRLQLAAESGQVKVAEFLLANGADVNANFGGRGTPLHQAARSGHKTMTELLLRHGAEVNSRDASGTPLHFAVENGHLAVAEVLLANKADVNAKGDGWSVTGEMTPLHMAAFKGFTTIAELLLANGAQVNSTDKGGQTPLHYAATYLQSRAIAQLLVTNKAEVNARSEDGWTPLHFAVKNSRLPIARLLLEHQAEVNARIERGDHKGWTPLQLAAMYSDKALAELLLANKAEVDGVTANGQTPLILAAGRKMPEVVDALLAAGANVNAQLENRHTALSLAVQTIDERTVSVILARKPDLELRGEKGLTVLQDAVANRRDTIAELLLQAGANPNVYYDQDGNTPLHWAVEPKRKPLVKLLLADKANPNARNNNGRTPLDLTKSSPNYSRSTSDQQALDDIATLLKEAGADEQLQRRSAISISRRSREYLAPWFVQGSNTWNRFTLLELIAGVYGQTSPVAFPDFARVTISRLGSAGSRSVEIAVDVEALIASRDCSKDVPLEWGDVVEIPERDRKLNEIWGGLSFEVITALKKCLDRKVDIIIKGEATKLTLTQDFIYPGGSLSTPQASMFWLGSTVRNANVLRASSDLRRVKVRRVDPATKQPREIILNVERADPRTDLWLKDGDAIEVPEKDSNAPAARVTPNVSPSGTAPAQIIVRPPSQPK